MYIETCQGGIQRIFEKNELLRHKGYNKKLIAMDFYEIFLIIDIF